MGANHIPGSAEKGGHSACTSVLCYIYRKLPGPPPPTPSPPPPPLSHSLGARRRDIRLILLYKGLKGVVSIPTDDLIHPHLPPIRGSRNHHSLTFQTLTARTDIYKGSFFSKTNRDWNALPDSRLGLPLW